MELPVPIRASVRKTSETDASRTEGAIRTRGRRLNVSRGRQS
jgi:hypothetical protein